MNNQPIRNKGGRPPGSKVRELSGQRFGKLVAIERITGTRSNPSKWVCKCDCGNTVMVRTQRLTSGETGSCGCKSREMRFTREELLAKKREYSKEYMRRPRVKEVNRQRQALRYQTDEAFRMFRRRHVSEYNKSERGRELNRKYMAERSKDPKWAERLRRCFMKSHYNLTVEQYEDMLVRQRGVCAVCSGVNPSGKRLCVDHDHRTGMVRALLCGRCNSALGQMRDSPELIEQLLLYARKHRQLSLVG